MTDKTDATPEVEDGQGQEPSEAENLDKLPEWARGSLTKANKEAAKYRTELKEARERLKAIEDAQRKTEEAYQAELGEYKPLYEKTKAEVETLRAQAKRVEEIETTFKDMLQKRLDAIPEQNRKRVPEFDDPLKTMAWLDANADLFGQRTAPNLDAGAQGDTGKGKAVKLTATQLMAAKKMGMKPEQYAKRLAESVAAAEMPEADIEIK
jgi:hypothetical protein